MDIFIVTALFGALVLGGVLFSKTKKGRKVFGVD